MKTVIKKARKGQYERKYRTTGKTGPASECVTKKIDKPTAQLQCCVCQKELDWSTAYEVGEGVYCISCEVPTIDALPDLFDSLNN